LCCFFNAFKNVFGREMTAKEQIVTKNILKNQITEALHKISNNRDSDYGQSTRLFENLTSLRGIYAP